MSTTEKASLLIAPGQGSQRPRLIELADAIGEVGDTYDLADSIALEIFGKDKIEGRSLSGHAEKATKEELASNTAITQPLIVATSIGLIKYLKKSRDYTTAYGHSLGELSALYATGSISEYEAIKLSMLRGIYSREAAKQKPGAMAVLLNLPSEIKERLLNTPGNDENELTISTDNSPDQITISGPKDKVLSFVEGIKEQYQKVRDLPKEERRKLPNAVIMRIEGAFHHAIMRPAQIKFRKDLDAAEILVPHQMNWFSGYSHNYEASPEVIRSHLANQMVNPVHFWVDIGKLILDGHMLIVESGAGSVLSDGLKEQQQKLRLPPTLEILAAEEDMIKVGT